MQKKVLIFSNSYQPFVGGAEIAIKEITERISGEDFEFDMITLRFDSSLPEFERVGNINVYRIGFSSANPTMADLVKFPLKINKLFFPFAAYFKAKQLHKKNNYDIAWSMMASFGGFAASFFKGKYPQVRFLLTLQEGDPIDYIKKKVFFVYPLFKNIFRRADYIQAISNYLAGFAKEMGATCPISVVPNAVAIENFTKEYSEDELNQLKNKIGKEPDERYLITTSRLVKKNACGDVIKALQYLPRNIKFLILGEGPDREELEALTSRLKLEKRVFFLGQINHEEMPKYLKIADIFIRPSLSEGLGNSFLEAMAAGLPVIATPVGGIPDFLIDRETGFFCQVKNSKSIADQVKLILTNTDLKNQVVKNAETMVREKYDWEKISFKMRDIFKSLN